MQRLYVAAHLPEVYFVRGLLAAAGIPTHVVNEYAPGALGELPAAAVRPELWLDAAQDLSRARQIVDAYEQQNPVPAAPVYCRACGEESPGDFAICWNCQRPLAV